LDADKQSKPCALCGGTKVLDQAGIMKVYLFPAKFALSLMAAGCVLGVIYSAWWLVLAVLGFAVPLANADLRLTLYPVVSVASLCGKKVNCPNCADGSVFSRL